MFRRIFKDKKTRKACHIYQMLERSEKGRHLSFHTPGHKQKGFDITELSYSDNLACPRGCIAQAERDIAQITGATKSFILTDGSTCGVFSMLQAAKTLGAQNVYLLGEAHSSFYNACAALSLTPLPVADGADTVFCTSPDYYGNLLDLEAVKRAHADKLLLVDGAHGGHLHFDKTRYAGAYADFWVDGVHKSLPALTQGAAVHANGEKQADALAAAVQLFRTTSPSYPIMASVEYAFKYPRNQRLEERVKAFAERHERILLRGDWTKLCVLFGRAAFEAENYFERQGIFPEFCDGNELCFYLSPATKARELARLQGAIENAFVLYPLEETATAQRDPAPLVFLDADGEWVVLEKSAGRVCAATCGIFPPCLPLLKEGEKITQEKIELLEKANNVFGLNDGKIFVFKEN